MHERASTVRGIGALKDHGAAAMMLVAAAGIACGFWLLARELNRRVGRGLNASARRDGQLSWRWDDASLQLPIGRDWDVVDEASAGSFPASDPPGYYLLSL